MDLDAVRRRSGLLHDQPVGHGIGTADDDLPLHRLARHRPKGLTASGSKPPGMAGRACPADDRPTPAAHLAAGPPPRHVKITVPLCLSEMYYVDAMVAPKKSAMESAADLSRLIRELRRILRMRLRQDLGQPLPGPAAELLRLTAAQPGLRVGDAAKGLHIAPNTTSTLVRQLTAAGLLERTSDDRDGRVARLTLTPAGTERLRHWRDQRAALIADALAALAPADRAAIEGALPALDRLVHVLDDRG